MPIFTGLSVLVVMDATVSLAGGAQIRVVRNTFAYKAFPPAGGGEPTPMMDSFKAFVGDQIAARLSTDYQSFRLFGYLRCDTRSPTLTASAPCQNGQKPGDRLPITSCVNLILRTGLRGRNFMGRKLFSAIPTSDVIGDELDPAQLPAWNFVAAQMLSGFTDSVGTNWRPCLFSRQLSQRLTLFPFFNPWLEELTSIQVNKTLGLCRHRRERTER